MRATIKGGELNLFKVFSNEFAFTIPGYQRPYAWTRDQANELLDDLFGALPAGQRDLATASPYFLGSIVLIKTEQSPDAQVVDGQQRLTTLTMLLAALRATFGDADTRAELTAHLYERGRALAGIPNRYRLRLRDRDAEFFRRYVQDEGGLEELEKIDLASYPDAQRRIAENALLLLTRLRQRPEAERLLLAQYLITSCFLVVVSTSDFDSAYRIFSVLNDRGLDLSHTDILKADVIGRVEAPAQEAYTEKWEDCEEELGRDAFGELFAHVRTVHRKVKPRDTILKEIREYVKPADRPRAFIDETLIPFADAFSIIRDSSYEATHGAEAVNETLRWLRMIDHSDWIPPALVIIKRHRDAPELLGRLLRALDRLASVLMIGRAMVNERIERYGTVLEALDGGKDLLAAGGALELRDEERARARRVLDGPLYEERKVRAYALLRLDAALAEGAASYQHDVISVEHVLPQHPRADSEWMKIFPDGAVRDRWVHRLGNLLLLSQRKNSEAQNYDFATKKQKYFLGKKSTTFALTTQVLSEKEWTLEVLERRQKTLLEVASRVFGT